MQLIHEFLFCFHVDRRMKTWLQNNLPVSVKYCVWIYCQPMIEMRWKNTDFSSQIEMNGNMGRSPVSHSLYLLIALAQYSYQFTYVSTSKPNESKWSAECCLQWMRSYCLFLEPHLFRTKFSAEIHMLRRQYNRSAQYKQQHWNRKSPSKPTFVSPHEHLDQNKNSIEW